MTEDIDRAVRLAIYERIAETGEAPTRGEVAGATALSDGADAESFARLADVRAHARAGAAR